LAILSAGQVDLRLKELPGWKRHGDFISKEFKFKKFMDGIRFVDELALLAEKLDHHPDIHVVWTTVTLQIQTHDEGGVTALDIGLATEIEANFGKAKPGKTKKLA
jgi:4a-hydroxytetrahydrobiopterin dehydratase